MMIDAVAIMAESKISELPVVDRGRQPVGLIDITDVVGLFPEARGWPTRRTGCAATGPASRRPARRQRQAHFQEPAAGLRMKLEQRCQEIELILADVDGVLTGGRSSSTTRASRPSSSTFATAWASSSGSGPATASA